MRRLSAADHKLYAVTFKKNDGKTLLHVFATDGKFQEDIFLPLEERNPEQLYPFSISKNSFYQLIENEETETWELFVTPVK